VVAYRSRSLAAGSSDKAAHREEIERPAGKGRREKGKKIVFYTSEATILLKTKGWSFEKWPKRTDLEAQISPKMRSKTAFFANLRPHLHPERAKLQGATWRFKAVPADGNPPGLARSSVVFGQKRGLAGRPAVRATRLHRLHGQGNQGWRRLRSLESAISRRDQGGGRGISSQPSAKRAFGRSQTLKNNLCASPREQSGSEGIQ
jgi:hypothetical protein